MPREQKQFKYRCQEPCCAMLVRSDKWSDHCRKKHGYKYSRNMDVKYKIVEVKNSDTGSWTKYKTNQLPTAAAGQGRVGDEAAIPAIRDDDLTKTDGLLKTEEVDTNALVDSEESESRGLSSFSSPPPTVTEASSGDGDIITKTANIHNMVSEFLVESSRPNVADVESISFPSSGDVTSETNVSVHSDSVVTDRESGGAAAGVRREQDLTAAISGVPAEDFKDDKDPSICASMRVTQSLIASHVNSPCQPGGEFAFAETNGRHFMSSWFHVSLPNGTKQRRHWLSYSKITERAYCIDCILFGGVSSDTTWVTSGYQGWSSGHGIRGIERHEKSVEHRTSEIARLQWLSHQRIDKQLVKQHNSDIEQNRRVMVVIIKAVKYLSSEMIALRGHNSQGGKLIQLFKLLAEFEPSAAGYLEKLEAIRARETRTKPEVNFLSPLNTRRLLTTMKTLIVEKISESVQLHGAYSIICDGTQDKSKLEAEAVLVRYIECKNGSFLPVERLVDVFTTGDTTGEGLCDAVLNVLEQASLNLESLVGQSYDGAGNVRGKLSGLRTRITERAPRALYVWCHAHRLNLVIESMLSCNTDIVGVIGLLQELHNFFGGHKRHAVLLEMQKNEHFSRLRSLKRVSDTTRSWRSVEDGVQTVIDRYDVVELSLEKMRDESVDAVTVSSATGLVMRLQEFKVIVCLFLLKLIFSITGPVSRLLQGISADLSISSTLLQGCINQFQRIRDASDEHWRSLIDEASNFAIEHDIQPVFPQRRIRKTKLMPGEIARDERLTESNESFKVNVFIRTVDEVLMQMKERFSDDTVTILKEMQHFTPATLRRKKPIGPDDIHNLCQYYNLDAEALVKEVNEFSQTYLQVEKIVCCAEDASIRPDSPSNSREEQDSCGEDDADDDDQHDISQAGDRASSASEAQGVQQKWADNGFSRPLRVLSELTGFPNLTYLYKILVSIAVTSCSAERAMSRVRIIKNRMRSTMLDDWFASLMVLASEKDLLNNISVDNVIDRFARISVPLQKQLLYHGSY